MSQEMLGLHKRRPGDKSVRCLSGSLQGTQGHESTSCTWWRRGALEQMFPRREGSKQSHRQRPRTRQGSCDWWLHSIPRTRHSEGHCLTVTTLCPWGLRVCTGISHTSYDYRAGHRGLHHMCIVPATTFILPSSTRKKP